MSKEKPSSKESSKEFPDAAGFSVQNLWYMRQFFMEYKEQEKLQPLVGEIFSFMGSQYRLEVACVSNLRKKTSI